MDIINYKLHIPRPSLSSGSYSGRSSTDSIKTYDRKSQGYGKSNHHKIRRTFGSCDEGPCSMTSLNSGASINNKKSHRKNLSTDNLGEIHRGSRSSQGSLSDGPQSLQSASSLPLSVANLENFTKAQSMKSTDKNFSSIIEHQQYDVNSPKSHLAINIENTKDLDQVSIASSTHFTVVNGFGRSNVKPTSSSICRQGRQITILIVTMSILFMIGICAVLYLMDRRARAMPEFHQ